MFGRGWPHRRDVTEASIGKTWYFFASSMNIAFSLLDLLRMIGGDVLLRWFMSVVRS